MSNLELTIRWTLRGQSLYNVLQWNVPDTSAAVIQAVADQVRSDLDAYYRDYMSSELTLQDATARPRDGGGSYSLPIVFTAGSFDGASLSDPLPNQICALASTTFVGPPPNRGRIYFPGPSENYHSVDGYTPSMQSDMSAMVIGWAVGFAVPGGQARLVIARINNPGNTYDAFNFIDAAVLRDNPATLRSRALAF